MPFFTRQNASIHYTVLGRGRTIVLIHGLGANHGFWGPRLLLPLARRFHVVLPDLRGHGRSSMPPSGYGPDDFALDLVELLDRLQVEKADLVGHSFGGVVALQCAVAAPERVRSIFLADTRLRSLEDPESDGAIRESAAIRGRLDAIGLPLPRDEREAGLWLLEQFASPCSDDTRQQLGRTEPFIPFYSRTGGNRSARRWLDLLRTTSLRDEFARSCLPGPQQLAALWQPVMAMCGDSARTRHSTLALARLLPQLRVAMLAEAGHFFPVTHTAPFLSALINFLAEVEELRDGERLPVNFGVDIFPAVSPLLPGTLLNVSRGGLLVRTAGPLTIGCRVEILPAFGAERPLPPLDGTIVRREANDDGFNRFGIALEPQDMNWPALLSALQGTGGRA